MPDLDFDNLAWCEIDGTLIFLDIAQDRYFRLPETRNAAVLGELDASGRVRAGQPAGWCRPPGWAQPMRQSPLIDDGPFRLGEVARSLWVQRRVERRLAGSSFAMVLKELRQVVSHCALDIAAVECGGARTVRAFEHARLLRTAADRCLPRSIALALCLAARGCRAQVVIGVKLAPFAAHCWAQSGDEVLNDTAAEVRRYTPIMVV